MESMASEPIASLMQVPLSDTEQDSNNTDIQNEQR